MKINNAFAHKIAIIFLSYNFNISFLVLGIFEYPQHMFQLRNKKIIFDFALPSERLGNPQPRGYKTFFQAQLS